MLFLPAILAASALLPVSVVGVGRAIVVNQCDSPIYIWSVGGSIGPKVLLNTNTSYSEVFHRDPRSGGIAIKGTMVDEGLFKPNVSQAIFSYNIDVNTIWYDLSQVFGDLRGRTFEVVPKDPTCASIYGGSSNPPSGSQTKSCQANTDLVMTFCPNFCLAGGTLCGNMAPGQTRQCCIHCIGSHHCVPV